MSNEFDVNNDLRKKLYFEKCAIYLLYWISICAQYFDIYKYMPRLEIIVTMYAYTNFN